ncbi:MAG: hypothetical protein ACXWNG_05690, partial [Candidatus Limnocylindrales bacterium]
RQGTPERLAALGEAWGFAVEVVPPLLVDGRQVGSSEIRRDVTEGELGRARQLLGRALSLVGERRSDSAIATEARLELLVPMALPPVGRYRVAVGLAWRPGEEPEGATTPAVAMVGADAAHLELVAAAPLPPGRRLRVVFERRLGSSAGAADVASVARSR